MRAGGKREERGLHLVHFTHKKWLEKATKVSVHSYALLWAQQNRDLVGHSED